MQLVQTVVKIVKFHLSQHKANQSIALNVFRNTNPKTEVAQDMGEVAQDMGEVAQDMGEVAQVGEVAQDLTEDHEKCTKRLVAIVVKIVKFHSNQNRTNQSIATNVSQIIEEIKKTAMK